MTFASPDKVGYGGRATGVLGGINATEPHCFGGNVGRQRVVKGSLTWDGISAPVLGVFLIELRCSNSCVENVGYVAHSCRAPCDRAVIDGGSAWGARWVVLAICISTGPPISQGSGLPRFRMGKEVPRMQNGTFVEIFACERKEWRPPKRGVGEGR